MPKLDTPLHLAMYRAGQQRRSWSARLKRAVAAFRSSQDVYGSEWGDPDTVPPLMHVRDHYLMPYVTPTTTILEIGPGGGRWTRYMLAAKTIYAVDYHQPLLDALAGRVTHADLRCIHNHGDDFPGVPEHGIDFLFSFGTFVHLELDLIERYLGNMLALLRPGATVVLQYADKTKPLGAANQGFAENDPATMRRLVRRHGYTIQEEDLQTLWHSAVIRFGPG